jgi:hypothetical protein
MQPAKVAVTLSAVHRPQRLRLQEPRRPRSPLHHCCQRVQQTLQPGPRLGTLPQHPRCASRVQDLPLGCLRPCFCRWQRPLDCARPVRGHIFGSTYDTWNISICFRMLETGRRAIRSRLRVRRRRVVRVVRRRRRAVAVRRAAVRRRPHSPQTLNHFLSPSSVHDMRCHSLCNAPFSSPRALSLLHHGSTQNFRSGGQAADALSRCPPPAWPTPFAPSVPSTAARWLTETIFPRIYARRNCDPKRARYMSFSFLLFCTDF